MKQIFCMLFVLICAPLISKSQSSVADSAPYFVTFEEQLTTRLSISRRYTSLALDAPDGIRSLRYKPNTLMSMGINATYKSLSVSLGSGFGFLNPNKDKKGKTKSFDFQTHLYTRDWVTDIYAQLYKGYYLSLGGPAGTADKNYYVRPDVKVHLYGASVYRLLNGDKFSYRAGFLQNEWQKKSAGSLLIGAEAYYGSTKGDSALVPSSVSSYYPQQGIKRVRFFEIGPGAGYAYTGVWQEHLFLTGSVTINGDISFVKEESSTGSANRTNISPNATLRIVGGYNSEEWAATISWLRNTTNSKGRSSNFEYGFQTGEFRFTIAKRFTPGPRLKKTLDNIISKLP